MNKHELAAVLWERLSVLPAAEIARSIDYYMEMIDDRMDEGMSEEEAVETLEPVEVIVGQILADAPAVRTEPKRRRQIWTTVLAGIGLPIWLSLMLALAAVVLAVYITAWAAIASVWAVVVSLMGGGLLAVAGGVFQAAVQGAAGWYTLGGGMAAAGGGMLLIQPTVALTRLFWRFSLHAVKRIGQRMRRRRDET